MTGLLFQSPDLVELALCLNTDGRYYGNIRGPGFNIFMLNLYDLIFVFFINLKMQLNGATFAQNNMHSIGIVLWSIILKCQQWFAFYNVCPEQVSYSCAFTCNIIKCVLAHRIRISEILPWDKKSYLTHAILHRLSRDGYIHWLYWNSRTLEHAHCRQVASFIC